MRWSMPVALFIVCLVAGSATAQLDPNPDGIGIYRDEAASWPCLESAAPYTNVTVYLVATRVSAASGISGWEMKVVTQPVDPPVPFTYALVGGGSNALSPPNFRVSLPAALPRADSITLMTLSTFYLGGGVMFCLGPCEPTAFPDAPGPGYTVGDDPERRVRLTTFMRIPVSGQPDTYWVGTIGYACGTPVDAQSWGAVKKLYDLD